VTLVEKVHDRRPHLALRSCRVKLTQLRQLPFGVDRLRGFLANPKVDDAALNHMIRERTTGDTGERGVTTCSNRVGS